MLGACPLGYARKILDEQGQFLGYGGRREVYGDKLVGAMWDKSERYPLEEFRKQIQAITKLSKKYVWVYAHGSTWWALSDEELGKYRTSPHKSMRSIEYERQPVVKDLVEYYKVIAASRKPAITEHNE